MEAILPYIIITIVVFLIVVLALTFLLLFAKAKLIPSGKVKITINGDQTLEVDSQPEGKDGRASQFVSESSSRHHAPMKNTRRASVCPSD